MELIQWQWRLCTAQYRKWMTPTQCNYSTLRLKKRTNFETVELKIIYFYELFSVSGLKDEKWIRKQTYTKTEGYKLHSSVFWIFLPNVIKIDPYNFELHHFKVGAFFETQCTVCMQQTTQTCIVIIICAPASRVQCCIQHRMQLIWRSFHLSQITIHLTFLHNKLYRSSHCSNQCKTNPPKVFGFQ